MVSWPFDLHLVVKLAAVASRQRNWAVGHHAGVEGFSARREQGRAEMRGGEKSIRGRGRWAGKRKLWDGNRVII
jgi:hypothetical protein